MTPPQPSGGFHRFLTQARHDWRHWLFYMACFSAFRLGFVLLFRNMIDPKSSFHDILLALLNGMRYDSMVATWWVVAPFVLGSLTTGLSPKFQPVAALLRRTGGFLFITITTSVWIVTYGYFREYSAHFNHFIFNLYYDDTQAILQTIWADYHPIPILMVIVLLSFILVKTQRRILNIQQPPPMNHFVFPRPVQILALTAIIILIIAGVRGSLGRRPAQRKDVAITMDDFLNKAVLNPYFALLYAVRDHKKQIGATGLTTFLPDGDIRKAVQEFNQDQPAPASLDEALQKQAAGPKSIPPRHIFLIVMESGDAWPFLPRYAPLGLVENLKSIGKAGLHFKNFLPASEGTMNSLAAIITDLPYAGLETNYQLTAQTPYPSSLFAIFNQLGYRTRLFYGGYLSWQRLGDFAHDQGVQEIYGAPHMSDGVATYEWGVDDEYLLDFITRTVDDAIPSFNLILTTSYHPPYNVDLPAKGFPLHKVPTELTKDFDNTTSLNTLGHLWYADQCLGNFVQKAETILTTPLFAITGDHFGRKFINGRPDLFERSTVPLILYGPEVLRGMTIDPAATGSHIDIGPTLIELTAPKGFIYHAVGRDLLTDGTDTLGIGWKRVIGKNFIADLSGRPKYEGLPGINPSPIAPDLKDLAKKMNQVLGIGWWRVKHGRDF
ncbi:MAG: sulfatase-like hydrolase/transferase [Proteobacteria bacterium]|nr:sulfatase-like hydrolase/transferase [Pseudomonadota bacterium]MBU1687257.1 sulfatase-like hydrolase/transferase [Pseudomonadota bacterium]